MKTSELIRLLKKNGCYFLKPLAGHDLYKSPITGKTIMIGRHKHEEVASGTLNKILKDAGIKK